jgi:predicted component of type VI protein secretion system
MTDAPEPAPPTEATAAVARLTWLRADGQEVAFPLEGSPLLIGRDEDADIRVDEPLVSRAHARIERRGPAYFVLDLGSTNLTRVNGEPVHERELRDGDEVRFGRARCRFAAPGPDPVATGV